MKKFITWLLTCIMALSLIPSNVFYVSAQETSLPSPQIIELHCTADFDGDCLFIEWNQVAGADGYYVYRKIESQNWRLIQKITDGTTEALDYNIVGGKTYYYAVSCVKDGKEVSKHDATGKKITYIAAPWITTIKNVSNGVYIKWSKSVGSKKYMIYRNTYPNFEKKYEKYIGTTTSTSYVDKTAKNGVRYDYTVYAIVGSKKARNSSSQIVYVKAPTIVKTQNIRSKKIKITWKKQSNITGYEIQYSKYSDFRKSTVTKRITSKSTLSKTLTGLTKNKTYYVRMRAYKMDCGERFYSSWTAKKSIKIKR